MKTYLSPKNIFVGAMAVSATVLSTQASAAGYQIHEVSPSLMGNAYAGMSTSNEDISSMAFNPATLAMIDEHQFYVAGTGIFPGIEANNAQGFANVTLPPPLPPLSGSFPVGDKHHVNGVGKDAFVPAVFVGLDVNEMLKLGFSLTSPFGLATKYDPDWAGQDFAVYSRLTSINMAPIAAFSFNDHFSVAAGAQFQYLDAKLTQNTPVPTYNPGGLGVTQIHNKVEGYGWGYGYTLGALYEFTKHTRVGVGYQSRMDTTIKGNASATGTDAAGDILPIFDEVFAAGSGNASTKITTPDNLNFGAWHDINKYWSVMANAQWTHWSLFKDLTVDVDSSVGETSTTVVENWDNSWLVTGGITFRPTKKWTIRGGAGWDESPVTDEFRNPILPDSDRVLLSAGLGYEVIESLRIDFAYMHLFFQDVSVDLDGVDVIPGVETKSMSADYNGYANLYSLGLSWEF